MKQILPLVLLFAWSFYLLLFDLPFIFHVPRIAPAISAGQSRHEVCHLKNVGKPQPLAPVSGLPSVMDHRREKLGNKQILRNGAF
ncbi:hypothetical protein ABFU84_00455 [Xanthomonas translucens pv. undulosa]|uniref:hypothetical protein n=1 Tax=Xanthomonas campestris pv. translucens TaxID=343 RepID=UPI001BB0BAFD|nr:hypothetical protein [Xanthomonas translucens]UPU49462.1 hypothetical protein MZO50_03045 [Xanthomonas translucens pv. undulosa]